MNVMSLCIIIFILLLASILVCALCIAIPILTVSLEMIFILVSATFFCILLLATAKREKCITIITELVVMCD